MMTISRDIGRNSRSSVVRRGVVGGAAGAVVGGLPSTIHALATGRDPLEATLAAGSILLPHEERRRRLLAAAVLAHGSISLLWGVVLAALLPALLPRRRAVLAGSCAGLVIAGVDLGVIGRRIPRVRALSLGPQVADHVLFGAVVGWLVADDEPGLHAQRVIPAEPSAVFEFLADLRNHWRLDDCFAELESLDGGERQPRGGTVQMKGPFGITRTARTRVIEATAPRGDEPGHLAGTAQIGSGTRGRVAWTIAVGGPASARVTLTAELDGASIADRTLFLAGRPWLERTFARILANLAREVGGRRP